MSSFPTLSSSSPGAIKMRFPNSREGDAALPRGGGKGQKKFCVPPRVTRRGAWLGTGRTGCGCVQHPSERGRVKPHLPGAPRFLGKKKKRMQCGGGLLAARCPPGCSEPGWRGVRGARPRGSFPCLFPPPFPSLSLFTTPQVALSPGASSWLAAGDLYQSLLLSSALLAPLPHPMDRLGGTGRNSHLSRRSAMEFRLCPAGPAPAPVPSSQLQIMDNPLPCQVALPESVSGEM